MDIGTHIIFKRNMKEIITITRKDLQLLFLDRTSLIVTFALPLVLIALIGNAFSSLIQGTGITSYDYAFSKVMFWGLIGAAASSVASLAIEKNSGTILRLQLSPVSRIQMLLGKTLACLTIIIFSSFLSWLFATLVFDVKTKVPVYLIVIILSNAVFFSGLMAFLGNFVKTERAAGGLSWSVLQILACFSGVMFPLTFMPAWMITVTNLNPLTWGVQAMEIALWKSVPFQEMILPAAIPTVAGIFFFGLSILFFKWTQ